MKIFQLLGIVALATLANALRPCPCPFIWKPVCGTDGRTYPNECGLNCEKSQGHSELQVAHEGKCEQHLSLEAEEVILDVPPCPCPYIWRPVCGTDGHTYPNECGLKCAKDHGYPELEVAHKGRCEQHHSLEAEEVLVQLFSMPCACNRMYLPVCGSDGETYANPCLLNCAKRTNPELEVTHEGQCEENHSVQAEEILAQTPCGCDSTSYPICGSDGKTYNNPCLLYCEKYAHHHIDLEPLHEGPCVTNLPKELFSIPCVCNRMYMPVCGSDGKTYANPCMLNCAKRTNPEIAQVYEGECHNTETEAVEIHDPCVCTKIYWPVCGTDGKTYPNICVLRCAAASNSEIKFGRYGKCEAEKAETEEAELQEIIKDPCTCNKMYVPVCGSDGKTYSNPCKLNCAKHSGKPDLVMERYGRCDGPDEEVEEELIERDPCICNKMYLPVCGSDGNTYSNPCVLNCAKHSGKPDLVMKRYGSCDGPDEEVEEELVERDPCICNRMYLPVCGSDGNTYSNPCMLNCAKHSGKPDLRIERYGHCAGQVEEAEEEILESDPCACNKMLRPVCGTDGKTYSNPCRLNCIKQTQNPGLEVDHYGECATVTVEEDEEKIEGQANKQKQSSDSCKCNQMHLPVCGTDGHTYANPCLLQCAKKSNPDLRRKRFGPCISMAFEEEKTCYCGNYYRPVCAKDGNKLKTFNNVCYYSCYARDNPNLQLIEHTSCEARSRETIVENEVSPCICTMEWNPVCGTNGHTYGNLCGLKCASKNNPKLDVAHQGPCDEKLMFAAEKSTCGCPKESNPVCGTDGKTYDNFCEFECAAKRQTGLGIRYPAACA